MDFGEILEQWETQQKELKKNPQKIQENLKKSQNSKISAEKTYSQQMEEDSKKKINPMELWIRRYGIVDKDAELEEYNQKKKMENREFLKNMRPEDKIDLHGMTREEAWQRLNSFVSTCKMRGLKKILIIHGKGNHSNGSDPVLGEMVRNFIETDKRLGASGHPDRNHGGNGATWVIIKQ